jgi:hypothetical protein
MTYMLCEPQTIPETLSARVVDTLVATPLRPTDLMQTLLSEATPREIQDTLSDLIEDGLVFLGTDRLLRARRKAA